MFTQKELEQEAARARQAVWVEKHMIVLRLNPLMTKKRRNLGELSTSCMIGARIVGKAEPNKKLARRIRLPKGNTQSPHNVVGLCGKMGVSTSARQTIQCHRNAERDRRQPRLLARLLYRIEITPDGRELQGLLGCLKQMNPKLYSEMTGRTV